MSRFRVLVAVGVVLALLSVTVGRSHHPHFLWDYIPGFNVLLGYGGCWLLVVGAKLLGRGWLERGEDYYDE